MAEKGLSPRQKMINLMYLVLTALLALNVSAEVLNAFVKFDQSIRKSTENIQVKNDDIYNEFQKAYTENKTKVEPWFKKAMLIKAESNSLDSFMLVLKKDIVSMADHTDEPDLDNIGKKSDNNVGSTIMITQKRGEELKERIDKYRELIIGFLKDTTNGEIDTSNALYKTVVSILNTDDVVSANDGSTLPWVDATFEHLPVIADVAMLSKMQNDVRNVESYILSYLLASIGKGEFHFNNIEAIVNTNSNYVLKGEPFRAEIFIAASDSTKDPIIRLKNGTTLPVENGKGIFEASTSTPGIYTIAGDILLKNPATEDTMRFPFQTEYQVGAPSVAISPTKMNVFYVGVDNPVKITASGVPAENLNVSMTGGRITSKGNGNYSVRVPRPGKATIRVSYKGPNGATKPLGSMDFRCFLVPNPYAVVGTHKGGSIQQNVLLAQTNVYAKLDNFVFDLTFPVTGFNVSTTINGFIEEASTRGSKISPEQKRIIGNLKRGNKVYFEQITCRAPDGSTRDLGTISFRIR